MGLGLGLDCQPRRGASHSIWFQLTKRAADRSDRTEPASAADVATWHAKLLVGAKLEPLSTRVVRAHASALTNSGEIEASSGGVKGS